MQHKLKQLIAKTTAFLAGTKLAGLWKVSFVVGSCTSFFTFAPSVAPLMGSFGGVAGSGLLFCALIVVRSLLKGFVAYEMAAFVLPGFIASLYWALPSALVRCVLPLVCMALFAAHPVGYAAFPYALYWLIPVGLYMFGSRSVVANAFGSTFVAHAVGSVVWLYAMPMTPAEWYALIPLVAVERTVFAVGMVVLHGAISFVRDACRTGISVPSIRFASTTK